MVADHLYTPGSGRWSVVVVVHVVFFSSGVGVAGSGLDGGLGVRAGNVLDDGLSGSLNYHLYKIRPSSHLD